MILIGGLNDAEKLSGIGLGNMVMNLLPYALMIGLNTALETLVSHAYGRKNLHECGLYLHRAIFLMICFFIPIALSFQRIEDFLVLIGVDETTAGYANEYLICLLPAILMNTIGDSVDIFLISMGYNNVVCNIQMYALPIHFFICWIFVNFLDWGIKGAAMANNLTALITLVGQIIYVDSFKEIKDAWFLPTMKTFDNIWPFLKLALPGILMLVIENLNMEILVLLAGMLHSADMLAAQVILVAFGQFMIMIPYGLALAAVSMVGHSLGANRAAEARENCKLVTVVSNFVFYVLIMVLHYNSS